MVDGYGMVRGIDVGVRRYLVMDSSSWPTGQGLGPTTSVGEVTSGRGKEMKDYKVRRYSFEELGKEAQDKAIEDTRSLLNEWVPEEYLTDELQCELVSQLGGEAGGIDLRYSLSYCQGDGVAIYGTLKREEAPSLSWPDNVAYVDLTRNSWSNHYSHYNTFNVEAFTEDDDRVEGEGVSVLEGQLRDLCRDLARYGYKCIEKWTSEEAALTYIKETRGDDYLLDGRLDYPVGVVEEELVK